jgi:hypothetical protein
MARRATAPRNARAGLAELDKLDRVIVMDSDPALLNAARHYVGYAPVICYGVDNHVRDYRHAWIKRYYLAHKAVSLMPWADDML